MAANRFITLDEVIIQRQSAFPYAKGELSRLLSNIGLAAKIVNNSINRAGLETNILGATDNINVQGIYDILGNRVTEMTAGNIYIVNGKKILAR